jgi:hypothetical protein
MVLAMGPEINGKLLIAKKFGQGGSPAACADYRYVFRRGHGVIL